MKRLFLTATLSLVAAYPGWCTIGTYTNNTYVTTVPLTPIDATNFVNLNLFSFFTLQPYDFSNVRSYTNRSVMSNSGSGFRFDTVPTSGNRHMAQNFYNASLSGNFSTNARVYAEYQLLISATNIVNRGLLSASSFGLVKLDGRNLDLSRSALQIGTWADRQPLYPEAVFDQEWGLGDVEFVPNGLVTATAPSTPSYEVTMFYPEFIYGPYLDSLNAISLFDLTGSSVTSAQQISEVATNRSVQYVFVRNPNTNIQVEIKFFPNPTPNPAPASPQVPAILWRTLGTNAFGQTVTNALLLTDEFAVLEEVNLIENFPFSSQPPQSVPIPPASYQPTNFMVSRTIPFAWDFLPAADAFVEPTPDIWTTNATPQRITANYSGYAFRLANSTTDPSQLSQTAITNIRTGPGRIEMNASGKLDLNLARIDGLNYVKINATNHFAGASNATIHASYADLNLASTNGVLDTRGLLGSNLPHLNGTVTCFSAKWQSLVFYENGSTNTCDFHVLWVDSDLQETSASEVLSLALRSTNAFVSDTINVVDDLNLDVKHLTIREDGVIQAFNSGSRWAASAPNMVTFTNFGTLNFLESYEEMGFHGLDSTGAPVPYGVFANFGFIYNNGCSILATNIINGTNGYLSSSFGPLALKALSDLTLDGGYLQAPNADISITCRNLNMTNANLLPGRGLWLSISDNLNAGTNQWTVYDGFHLLTKPDAGDFSETTITDVGYEFAEVYHTWAGEDRGVSVDGYTNNAALGQLELDGGLSTLFNFSGTGPGSNAIYIDHLKLADYAGQFDAQGGLSALQVNPGMTIYYAQATINGASVAEFLDGKHEGRLRWISSRAGPFSGVNVVYPDGSTNYLNAALVSSCNLDTDGDGIVNCIDPTPVPVAFQPQLSARMVPGASPKMALSWTSFGGAQNRVYSAMNPSAPQWQLVTNVVSPAAMGTPSPMEIVVPTDGNSRFYRVNVQPAIP